MMSVSGGVRLVDRFTATMLGGLVGDCLGAPFEFRYQQLVPLEKIDKFLEKIEAGDGRMYRYTDDTAMARQVAGSIVQSAGRLDLVDMAGRFVEEYYREPRRGYGGAVLDVFKKLRDTGCRSPHGPAAEQFGGSGSFGNGAAMRSHPVALFCHGREVGEVVEAASAVARITHSHRLGVTGAVVQAVACHQALEGRSPEEILDRVAEVVDELEKDYPAGEPSYRHKLGLVKELLLAEPGDDPDASVVCDRLGNDVAAVDSVPTALYCFLSAAKKCGRSDSLIAETLRRAVSVGGDTDTIASMACAAAGAWLGTVPDRLVKVCEGAEEAEQLGKRLWEMAGREQPAKL